MADPQTSVVRLLGQLRGALDLATAVLAKRCASGGRLDPGKLDLEQVPSYELAWATAELLAAQITLDALNARTGELDRRLAWIFGIEAITLVRDRLETLYAELDLDSDVLHAVTRDAELRSLQRQLVRGAALHDTARLLARDPADLAQVPVSEELTLVRDQFERFAAETVTPLAEKIHRHDLLVPEEQLLQPLREMGVFGLSIPERYGGSAPDDEKDSLTMIVVTEALSEASLAAAGSLITRPEILSCALITGGTEKQKQHWLPQIARGQPLCAIAITEPDFGSDVASLNLRGTRVAGGWLLDGTKTWCTFAGKAGVLMVVTRTNPDRSLGYKGLSLMLAEKPSFDGHAFDYRQDGGGRLVGRAIPTIGYRGMHSFELSFEEFFVPDANVIGEEGGLGQGFYYTMAGMMGGRLQTAARASGVMRAALLAGVRYAEERKVFGASLLAYPLTGAKLTKMAARYVVCRYFTYAIGKLLNQGGGRVEASLVKLFACRSAELVTREMLQLHGGMGYAEEVAVSRYFIDARVLSIFEGAEETLALKVVARSLLEAALDANAARPQ
ncbi:acyl-CoA dehydrogenase family protein [Nevskia sp.]|uniref:acyl-CoA dehydrogenase family protein n=1 Tax=Nevskia sp. TaxID=1929292 RepID=UPI00260022AB|nr:acyl-CoA dehydrogenase family protein [Nevskia sp.]